MRTLDVCELIDALKCCAAEKNSCGKCPAKGVPSCYEAIKEAAAEELDRLFSAANKLWTASDVAMPDKELAEYTARHPEEGGVVEVLVMIRGATEPTVLLYDGEGFTDLNGDQYTVDFWQPMPRPPKTVTG